MDAYRWVILFVIFLILNNHGNGDIRSDTVDLQSRPLRPSKLKHKQVKQRYYAWKKFRWKNPICRDLFKKGYFNAKRKNADYVQKNEDKRSRCWWCPFCFRP